MQMITRRKGRRIISILMSVLLVFCFVPSMAFAGSDTIVAVEAPTDMPESGYRAGDVFKVNVTLTNNSGFTGLKANFVFDRDVFELVSIDRSQSTFNGEYDDINTETGFFSILNMTTDFEDDGILAEAEFVVKEDAVGGDYSISVIPTGSENVYNENGFVSYLGGPVNPTWTSASIKIETPIPVISLGSISEVFPNDEFSIPVSIADNPGFAGAAFELVYDNASLEVVSVDPSGILEGKHFDWDIVSPNKFSVFTDNFADITGDGDLFEISFKVKEGAAIGPSSISIKLTGDNANNFVNMNAEQVTVSFTDSTVNIVEAPPEGFTIVAGKNSGFPTEEVTIPLTIYNNPGFAGATLQMIFDNDALEFIGVDTSNSVINITNVEFNPANGAIIFNNVDLELQENDGLLFDVKFAIKDDAPAGDYSVGVQLFNNNANNISDNLGDPIPVEFWAGNIEVLAQLPFSKDLLVHDLDQVVPYDGHPYGVEVLAADDVQIGEITVSYTGVEGTDYAKSTVEPVDAGKYLVSVDITDSIRYAGINDLELGYLTIEKAAAPELVWPTASDITYGQEVSDSVLSGGTEGYGTFDWDDSVDLTEVKDAGKYDIPVTFTPDAKTIRNYEEIEVLTKDVELNVNKAAAPELVWPTASDITYGQEVSDSVLSGGTEGYGTFDWDDSVDLTEVKDAGKYDVPVTFTPDANTIKNYEEIEVLTKDVELNVNKAAAPELVWPTASDIKAGDTLADSTLTGGSEEIGTFAWTDDSIAPVYPGGAYEVTFTPNDATAKNYEAIEETTKDVNVKVWAVGDVDDDGYLTMTDIIKTIRIISGTYPDATAWDYILCDIDNDGSVTIEDIILLMKLAIA